MADGIDAVARDTMVAEEVGSSIERTSVLWLTNFSHAVNHFQNQMVAVLYVVIMPELGFGYAELGVLTAVMSILGGASQASTDSLPPSSLEPGCWALATLCWGWGPWRLVGSVHSAASWEPGR
jgi:hypothetical protein